jgi:hypothetical protein
LGVSVVALVGMFARKTACSALLKLQGDALPLELVQRLLTHRQLIAHNGKVGLNGGISAGCLSCLAPCRAKKIMPADEVD